MFIGVVKGEVYSTIHHPEYRARRLLLVDRVRPDGAEDGTYLIAVAAVDAGVGQKVLVVDEGNSARELLDRPNAPIRSVIVGVVDAVEPA